MFASLRVFLASAIFLVPFLTASPAPAVTLCFDYAGYRATKLKLGVPKDFNKISADELKETLKKIGYGKLDGNVQLQDGDAIFLIGASHVGFVGADLKVDHFIQPWTIAGTAQAYSGSDLPGAVEVRDQVRLRIKNGQLPAPVRPDGTLVDPDQTPWFGGLFKGDTLLQIPSRTFYPEKVTGFEVWRQQGKITMMINAGTGLGGKAYWKMIHGNRGQLTIDFGPGAAAMGLSRFETLTATWNGERFVADDDFMSLCMKKARALPKNKEPMVHQASIRILPGLDQFTFQVQLHVSAVFNVPGQAPQRKDVINRTENWTGVLQQPEPL